MINKKTADIALDDIKILLSDGIPESKTLDYKRDLFLNTREEKINFLADVSAFANTSGGDLVYGIDEKNAVPKEITGIVAENLDDLILRMEQLVCNGLEPRVLIDPHHIEIGKGKYVLVVRVEKSHTPPHRVTLDGHDKFYSRASRSKYQLDVEGLRAAFNRTDDAMQKILNFRASRVSEIESGYFPLPVMPSGKAILHLIPTDSHVISSKELAEIFPTRISYDHVSFYSNITNFDGKLFHDSSGGNSGARRYAQLYRNGAIEVVHTVEYGQTKGIWIEVIETVLRFGIIHYLKLYEQLGFSGPFIAYISFTNVKGYRVAGERYAGITNTPIDRDVLLLPGITLEHNDAALDQKIQPVFDLIWNAVGISQSPGFDAEGKWKTK